MCIEVLGRSQVYRQVVEKPALALNALRGAGEGLPLAYLAVKLELSLYLHTYING